MNKKLVALIPKQSFFPESQVTGTKTEKKNMIKITCPRSAKRKLSSKVILKEFF